MKALMSQPRLSLREDPRWTHRRCSNQAVQELPAWSSGRSHGGGQVHPALPCPPLPSTQQEIHDLEGELERLTRTISPALVDSYGIGPDTAATLLVAAGSKP